MLNDGYKRYEEWLNALTDHENHFSEIYKECVIPSPCWMMHRKDFEAIGAFKSTQYPEDYDLCFRMYINGIRPISIKKICHLWRDHPQRASRNDKHYADNRFLLLKLSYFSRHELPHINKLTIWGAGKKGKDIAHYFSGRKIKFQWITNNPKKIGHSIYGIKLQDARTFCLAGNQFIIAVANPDDQRSIRKLLDNDMLIPGKDYFCFA